MQLIKIITHLISNGIKYNHPKGSVNIISTICSEGYIEIAIQDTGAGIQQHHWEDIFTAFTRLEYAEKKTDWWGWCWIINISNARQKNAWRYQFITQLSGWQFVYYQLANIREPWPQRSAESHTDSHFKQNATYSQRNNFHNLTSQAILFSRYRARKKKRIMSKRPDGV